MGYASLLACLVIGLPRYWLASLLACLVIGLPRYWLASLLAWQRADRHGGLRYIRAEYLLTHPTRFLRLGIVTPCNDKARTVNCSGFFLNL